jgi:hypothetical protein
MTRNTTILKLITGWTGPATPSTPLIHNLTSKMPAAHSASPPTRTYTGFVTARALLSKTLPKHPTKTPTKPAIPTTTTTRPMQSPPDRPTQQPTSGTLMQRYIDNQPHCQPADTTRATRQNPWRSSSAISLLTKTIQGFGAITTNYLLNAWKLQPYLWPSPPPLPAPTTTTHTGSPCTISPPNSRNQLHHRHRTQAAATSLRQPHCKYPLLCMLPLRLLHPDCHPSTSLPLPAKTPTTPLCLCPKPSPTRNGGHCTGTSGKTKTPSLPHHRRLTNSLTTSPLRPHCLIPPTSGPIYHHNVLLAHHSPQQASIQTHQPPELNSTTPDDQHHTPHPTPTHCYLPHCIPHQPPLGSPTNMLLTHRG